MGFFDVFEGHEVDARRQRGDGIGVGITISVNCGLDNSCARRIFDRQSGGFHALYRNDEIAAAKIIPHSRNVGEILRAIAFVSTAVAVGRNYNCRAWVVGKSRNTIKAD